MSKTPCSRLPYKMYAIIHPLAQGLEKECIDLCCSLIHNRLILVQNYVCSNCFLHPTKNPMTSEVNEPEETWFRTLHLSCEFHHVSSSWASEFSPFCSRLVQVQTLGVWVLKRLQHFLILNELIFCFVYTTANYRSSWIDKEFLVTERDCHESWRGDESGCVAAGF